MSEQDAHSGSPFQAIRAIDYTVIIVRDMTAMRRFYEDILGFRARGEPLPDWIEYGVGDNTLALTKPRRRSGNGPTPARGASLQLAFKVSASEVNQCADELVRQGIKLVSPPTGEAPARRTMFFRDPDGNLLEMFGDI